MSDKQQFLGTSNSIRRLTTKKVVNQGSKCSACCIIKIHSAKQGDSACMTASLTANSLTRLKKLQQNQKLHSVEKRSKNKMTAYVRMLGYTSNEIKTNPCYRTKKKGKKVSRFCPIKLKIKGQLTTDAFLTSVFPFMNYRNF